MCYLTTHSTHFIYGYMASDIWLRTILIVRKETRCRHIGYERLLLYAPSHRQDNTHVHIYTCTHIYINTYINSYKYKIHTHRHIHIHTYIHSHTYIQIYNTHIHTHIYIYVHAFMHSYIHTYT